MKRVSVIIPIYNVEPYIEECLSSVAAQTAAEFIECILVDDCGKDRSANIASRFIEEYSGPIAFSLLHHTENAGLSAARNTGIRAAKGEFLYFLDSDDTIVPECITTLLALADKHQAELVVGTYYSELSSLKAIEAKEHKEFSSDVAYIKPALLDYNYIPVTAANRLVSRQLILDNNLFFREGIIHEDNYWTFFLAKHVQRMAYCTEKTYYYRPTPGSITNKPNWKKETYSYKVRLTDFMANIDSVERGAQMKTIFSDIQLMIGAGYYESKAELARLLALFKAKNTAIERIPLFFWFLFRKQCPWLSVKFAHLLLRFYK